MRLKIATALTFIISTIVIISACLYNFNFSTNKEIESSTHMVIEKNNAIISTIPGFLDVFPSDVNISIKSNNNVKINASIGYNSDVTAWIADEDLISITGFSSLASLKYSQNSESNNTKTADKNSSDTVDFTKANNTEIINKNLDMWNYWSSGTGENSFNFSNSDKKSYSLLITLNTEDKTQNIGDFDIKFTWEKEKSYIVLILGLFISLILYFICLTLYIRLKKVDQKVRKNPSHINQHKEQNDIIADIPEITGIKSSISNNNSPNTQTDTQINEYDLISNNNDSQISTVIHKIDSLTIEKDSLFSKTRKEIRKAQKKHRFKK